MRERGIYDRKRLNLPSGDVGPAIDMPNPMIKNTAGRDGLSCNARSAVNAKAKPKQV
jgi:hypothetical protein